MTTRFRYIAVCLILFLLAACGRKEEVALEVIAKKPVVEGDRGTQFVTVVANPGQEWTISLTDENGQAIDWMQVEPATGVGACSSVTITWDRNYTGAERVVRVVCVSDTGRSFVLVTQQPMASDPEVYPDDIIADPVRKWMELPATNDPSLYFISHASATNATAGRNYSYYWDPNALVAHWVAYPLNKSLIASGSRTNEWGLDPKLPKSRQPWLFSGYRSSSSSGNSDGGVQWYDRGHQLPSADRLAHDDNVQTFYGTNMTPQINELNANIWASLESGVRDWSKQFDTLYVVTGCVVKGSTKYAYDNEGKKVTVPVGYYKAILGYDKSLAKGITAQTQGYTGVAFYLEHRGYSDNNYMATAMTIEALEEMVDVDFFVNLPAAIGDNLAAKVESTKDNFWWGK